MTNPAIPITARAARPPLLISRQFVAAREITGAGASSGTFSIESLTGAHFKNGPARAIRHCGDKTIASAGNGLYISRLVGRIAQSLAELIDRGIQPMFEIAEGGAYPQLLLKVFAAHDSVAVVQKDFED